jgi:hypothetical protein
MTWTRGTPVIALSLAIVLSLSGSVDAGSLSSHATAIGSSRIDFSWTFYEDPQSPVAHPEWVGYDVYRRSLGNCGPSVRMNVDPFPRVVGATHSYTYSDFSFSPGTTYQYLLVMVGANRQEVLLDPVSCDCGFGNRYGWASCPEFSGPLTQGTLMDWGWALYVQPCANSCYSGFYFTDPQPVHTPAPIPGSVSTGRPTVEPSKAAG